MTARAMMTEQRERNLMVGNDLGELGIRLLFGRWTEFGRY